MNFKGKQKHKPNSRTVCQRRVVKIFSKKEQFPSSVTLSVEYFFVQKEIKKDILCNKNVVAKQHCKQVTEKIFRGK